MNFKRFGEVEFRLPGHVVLAGPNNMGKTTVLQAIASWAFALRRWRELNDFNPRNGFKYAPISRPAFTTVPLRSFDLLWKDRSYFRSKPIEIELRSTEGWSITMEFCADSTEQVYVRPKEGQYAGVLTRLDLSAVYIPPMTGLGIDEPLFQPAKIAQLLGLGRPGEVLRNLIVEAHADQANWDALQKSIDKLFGFELLPPDANGAHIVTEYRSSTGGQPFDIASAGSGFQQVLMLLALLNTRPGALLLLDEPDAHLHIILQDAIYYELRTVAKAPRFPACRGHALRSGHKQCRAAGTLRHAQRTSQGRGQQRAKPSCFIAARPEQRRRYAGIGSAGHPLRRELH